MMKDNYGYSALNPVQLVSIRSSYEFFDKLLTMNGEAVTVKRLGSRKAENCKGFIDIYEVFRDGLPVLLFVYPYSEVNLNLVPQGFIRESDWIDRLFDRLAFEH